MITPYSIEEEYDRLNALRIAQARIYLRTSRSLQKQGRLCDAAIWQRRALAMLDAVRTHLENTRP